MVGCTLSRLSLAAASRGGAGARARRQPHGFAWLYALDERKDGAGSVGEFLWRPVTAGAQHVTGDHLDRTTESGRLDNFFSGSLQYVPAPATDSDRSAVGRQLRRTARTNTRAATGNQYRVAGQIARMLDLVCHELSYLILSLRSGYTI